METAVNAVNASPTYYLVISSSIFVLCKWLYRLERALDVEIELFLFRRDSYARIANERQLLRSCGTSKQASGTLARGMRMRYAYT